MASDNWSNWSLRNSYDLGRVECSLILHMMKRDISKPISKSKAKENTNIQISLWQGFSTSILDVTLSGKQDLI